MTYGGAERVAAEIIDLFPQADIFALLDFLPEPDRGILQGKKITTSFLQHLPGSRSRYRSMLPLMPLAVEQFELSRYDLIISSSHAVARGAIAEPNQLHIAYMNNTMEYVRGLSDLYLQSAGLDKGLPGLIARAMLRYVRNWDANTGDRVDRYVANSQHMAERVKNIYGHDSTVIYPPVDLERFVLTEKNGDYYVTAARLVPFKRIELIVQAFTQLPEFKLVVLGDGPDRKSLERIAGDNIEFRGFVNREEVSRIVAAARAFVFASVEPFGIALVEAQACGTPVIAYAEGGAAEIVEDGKTGVLFEQQSAESLTEAVRSFEERLSLFDPGAARARAEQFSTRRFRNEFRQFVETSWREHCRNLA